MSLLNDTGEPLTTLTPVLPVARLPRIKHILDLSGSSPSL